MSSRESRTTRSPRRSSASDVSLAGTPEIVPADARRNARRVSLRNRPVEQAARLPDGREVVVRVGVPDDPYIPKRELDTVDVEIRTGAGVLAVVTSVLSPEHESEARALAREIASGLEEGTLAPTAGAIEPLADRIP
jgi:uncharacterized protein with PhoU and TrkA domain